MHITPLRVVIFVLALAIVWLRAGRQIATVVDRFIAIHHSSLPVSPLQYDGGGFLIGNLSMTFGGINNLRFPLELCTNSSNRVILKIAGRAFILGPRTNPIDPHGRPEIDFVPDTGDTLSFTSDRGLVGWPTPFEFYILSTRSPWWKRYVAYRLVWKKPSGAKLDMRWRYEQEYYADTGWTEPLMMWNNATGLLSIEIRTP